MKYKILLCFSRSWIFFCFPPWTKFSHSLNSSIQNVQHSTKNLMEIGHFSDVNENRPVMNANGRTTVDLIVLPWNIRYYCVFPDLEYFLAFHLGPSSVTHSVLPFRMFSFQPKISGNWTLFGCKWEQVSSGC